jgi:hypothetical protein
MTTIMYWNVEQFSLNKIDSTVAPDDGGYADNGTKGTARLNFLLNCLQPANGNIDAFVLVEVKPGNQNNGAGNVINGNAGKAARRLLAQIRTALNNNAWCLVPPIVSGAGGRREAVAVYYNSNNLYFLGPRNGLAYAAKWQAGLPNRTIPGNRPINANANERTLGGQIAFQSRVPNFLGNVPGNPLEFPAYGYRRPFLTYFGAVGNPNRLIKILAYHSTPNGNGVNSADQGTAQLANIWEMSSQPVIGGGGVTEVSVILGDFNVVNLVNNNFVNGPYADLVGGAGAPNPVAPPYTALVQPPGGLNPADRTYYSTHFYQLGSSYIEHGGEPFGTYPGYAYLELSIDNAFVRVRNGGAAAPQTTIVNRVTGAPYTPSGHAPPPMLGHYQLAQTMNDTLDNLLINLLNDPDHYDADGNFREWYNYGKIRSTSDHLPLIFDV